MDFEPKKRKIVIDLDQNPEFEEILKKLTRASKVTRTLNKTKNRTNAIAGERTNYRTSLRRGLHPQE